MVFCSFARMPSIAAICWLHQPQVRASTFTKLSGQAPSRPTDPFPAAQLCMFSIWHVFFIVPRQHSCPASSRNHVWPFHFQLLSVPLMLTQKNCMSPPSLPVEPVAPRAMHLQRFQLQFLHVTGPTHQACTPDGFTPPTTLRLQQFYHYFPRHMLPHPVTSFPPSAYALLASKKKTADSSLWRGPVAPVSSKRPPSMCSHVWPEKSTSALV